MKTSSTQEETSHAASSTVEEPRRAKKANVRARKPRVAPSKGKSARKANPAQKGHKAPKAAKQGKAAASAREGSKTAKVLDLLKRPGGATLKELMKTTGWQPHSVRGFISGTLGKKMGLAVTSTKGEDGERSYSITG
jgi:hypothetical protein